MDKAEITKILINVIATLNTTALALYGLQGEPDPKRLIENIAYVIKMQVVQCETLLEKLE